jgi:hypothetical protein
MHRIIKAYLNQFVSDNALDDLDEADQFERFVVHCLIAQSFSDQYDLESVVTSTDDLGVDGVVVMIDDDLIATAEDAKAAFDKVGHRRSVHVEYTFIQAKRTEGFDLGEMLKLGTGVQMLVAGDSLPGDDVLTEFVEIHDLVVQNIAHVEHGRPSCTLYFATTGTWNETNGLRERAITPTVQQLTALSLFSKVSFEPVDRESLISYWVKTREPVQATFAVKGAVSLPPITGVTEAYVALAPAKDFVAQVLANPDGRLRNAVFDQNVRAFLGDDNPVNARMRAALALPEHHGRFAINNNGVTIVAPDVKVQSDRISVVDFQIVNGCQTSHVLYRNRSQLTDDVWVPVKVIEAQDPSVVSQLVQATNSQTVVDESQFLSVLPFTQKLEAYFDTFGEDEDEKESRLYFERRTNQYSGHSISRSRIFDLPKMARCFSSMFLDIPHIAYMYPTQVLRQRGKDLFRPEHKEHVYHTAALTLYRLESLFSSRIVPRRYQSSKWHIMMMVRYLVAGDDMPRLESSRIEGYCAKIDAMLAKGGRACAPPFLTAVKIIERLGTVTRDRRKGQRYTDELKAEARRTFKRQAAAKKGAAKTHRK